MKAKPPVPFQPPVQELRLLYAAAGKLSAQSDTGREQSPRRHSELYYFTSGRGELIAGSRRCPLSACDLLLLPPDTAYRLRPDKDARFSYYLIGLDGIDFAEPGANKQAFFCINAGDERSDYDFLFNRLLAEVEQERPSFRLISSHIVQILLLLFFRRTGAAPGLRRPGRSSRAGEKVRRYIEKNLAKPLSLDKLAEVTHLSKYYLVHIFKSEFGVPPLVYQNLRRIEESKRLLAASEQSIAKISDSLGFTNQSYFSRRFKEVVGLVPSAYRRKLRENPALPDLGKLPAKAPERPEGSDI